MKQIIKVIALVVFAAGVVYVVAQKFMNKQDVQIQKKGDIYVKGAKRPI